MRKVGEAVCSSSCIGAVAEADPHSSNGVKSQMGFGPEFFDWPTASRIHVRPLSGGDVGGIVCLWCGSDRVECLEEADEEE